MKHKNKIRVYLSIYGDIFNPEELTTLLQLTPIYTRVKGEVMRSHQGLYRSPDIPPPLYKDTAWDYGSDYVKTLDSEDVSIVIEDAIRDKITLINNFVEKHNLEVALVVVPYIDKRITPSISFSKSLTKILSDLNAQIIMDIYIA